MKKQKINFLVLWVGTKCSLKCRDCGNLIPYSTQESFDMDLIVQDLKKILDLCEVKKLQIQGGEPFTHPNIDQIISMIDKLDIPEIAITTNGTIDLNDNIINSLKKVNHDNFEVVLSSYDCAKQKQKNFHEKLIKNGIQCVVYDFFNNDGSWINQGSPYTMREDNDKKLDGLYSRCDFKICNSLVDGKLFMCGRGKVSQEVFDLRYTSTDFLNIRDIPKSSEGTELIRNFLISPQYKEYCRYCLGTEEKIQPAIQL